MNLQDQIIIDKTNNLIATTYALLSILEELKPKLESKEFQSEAEYIKEQGIYNIKSLEEIKIFVKNNDASGLEAVIRKFTILQGYADKARAFFLRLVEAMGIENIDPFFNPDKVSKIEQTVLKALNKQVKNSIN